MVESVDNTQGAVETEATESTEIWKDITNYEGRYQISDKGNVKSLLHNKILKVGESDKYQVITLYKSGIGKSFSVHRLVANAFLPNPQNFPCVNHKDENPENNCVDNLEWCTVQYNNTYGNRVEKARISNIGKHNMQGMNNPMFGKKHSDETKHKISISQKNRLCKE